MSVAAPARRTKVKPAQSRDLWETVAACSSPLKVDEEKGIIYGVKVLGRYSPNTYGLREAIGTEYPPHTQRAALPLYEGQKVNTDHLPLSDRRTPDKERNVSEVFGVLRNVRIEDDAIWADLHYNRKHPIAALVVEDVQRGLGLYGLSHNAGKARERFDRNTRRLVIESIGVVRSVDLVTKPATNRNLWESQEPNMSQPEPKKHTLRSLLESQRPRFSQVRLGWMDRLLEMEDMKAPLAEEGEMPAETAQDPADAMKAAFRAAGDQILDGIFDGSMDADEGFKKLKELFKTHGKLTQKDEPEEAKTESEEDGVDKPKDKTESVEVKLAKLERKDACRDLCESLGFTPKPEQLAALMEIQSGPARKTTAEAFKAAVGGKTDPTVKKPKSAAPGSRNLLESQTTDDKKIPQGTAGEISFLRRG